MTRVRFLIACLFLTSVGTSASVFHDLLPKTVWATIFIVCQFGLVLIQFVAPRGKVYECVSWLCILLMGVMCAIVSS